VVIIPNLPEVVNRKPGLAEERKEKAMLLRVFLMACLLAFLGPGLISAPALAKVRVVSDIDLSHRMQGKQAVRVEIDQGVFLELTAPKEGIFGEKLRLAAAAGGSFGVEGGKFEECLGVSVSPAMYWIVSEYSGGAHCCGVYHFFARPESHKPLLYLGKTEGHNGGPLPLRKGIRDVQGTLFFRDLDNRFDYFHESHAGSMLVNRPERFYQVSPTGIRVNNLPFKAVYLKNAEETQREIQEALQKRRTRPPAILKSGFGSGFNAMIFSDALGQLLVKRTIYLLFAREDEDAWESFHRDVARHYQTSRWAPELQAEIRKRLQGLPY